MPRPQRPIYVAILQKSWTPLSMITLYQGFKNGLIELQEVCEKEYQTLLLDRRERNAN